MPRRNPPTPLLARCSVGLCALLATGCAAEPAAEQHGETLVLLLADGPLTVEPAAERPLLEVASAETIVNHEIVPEVTIQAGLLLQALYSDTGSGRMFSVVAWPADTVLRRHWHSVTERLWMIEGSIASPDGEVGAGMFWEAPAQVAMGPFTSTGSFFAFMGEGPFETHYLAEGQEAPVAGRTIAVAPDTIPWQPLAQLAPGSAVQGGVKLLSARSETERGVYLVRLTEANVHAPATYGANLEGYVLHGELRLSDPYHGIHVLSPGFYFRIPRGFPSSLFGL